MITVLDVHKDSVLALGLSEDGKETGRKRIRATRGEMSQYLDELPAESTVIMESCYAWEYIYDMAMDRGLKTVVVDTGKLYPNGKPEKKNDIEDCRRIARLYRIGELPTIHVMDKARRDLRDLLRYRIFITQKITSFRNHVHFTVDRLGLRPGQSELFGERATDPAKWPIDRYNMIQLASCQKILEVLDAEEKAMEGEITRQLLSTDEIKNLLTIPGVGLITAAVLYLEIGPVSRFADKENLTGYAGLVPILEETDETTRHGRLRRRCNRYLRWAAIEAARHAVQCDAAMRERYLKKLRIIGGEPTKVQKAKAIVAVARHLLEIVWCMLTRGEVYKTPQKAVPERKMKALRQRARAYFLPIAGKLAKDIGETLEKDTGMSWVHAKLADGGPSAGFDHIASTHSPHTSPQTS